jgi:hypothetical protein
MEGEVRWTSGKLRFEEARSPVEVADEFYAALA